VTRAGQQYAAAAPLSDQATAADGRIGGLLPDVTLRGRTGDRNSRELRPAVVMLVQNACDCLRRLRRVATEAHGSKSRVYVVGISGREQVDKLASFVGYGVVPLVDEHRALDRNYQPGADAMLLLVRRDGVVVEAANGVAPDIDLASRLPALLKVP